MEGDGLETDQVVSAGHSFGDSGGPGAVISDHLSRAPRSAINSAR